MQDLVEGDGLTRIRGEDGDEEIIDRESWKPHDLISKCPTLKPSTCVALDSMFTGEEGMGRYLDLNIAHTQYVNLKGAKR